ncbi:MAG TPA: hypothetical protein IGS17_06340 [Oscillatoriales cyanobacterium M59_W2019_021]|nr:MAG: hypothetical protein D6728_13975 [Cyanobacteria bacterium J055]HIK32714.1 hypothetical protein [Oscillatoriales cyanobacterium M4454_W2019_049]HIK50531.1 hypothetical protein [Oscillatoriales cyanobacterium M59_W2019_021]
MLDEATPKSRSPLAVNLQQLLLFGVADLDRILRIVNRPADVYLAFELCQLRAIVSCLAIAKMPGSLPESTQKGDTPELHPQRIRSSRSVLSC